MITGERDAASGEPRPVLHAARPQSLPLSARRTPLARFQNPRILSAMEETTMVLGLTQG
jgi:hypothetical protein